MKRTKWNPRKLLVASAGVASVNYALAAGCGGEGASVANLVVCPPSQCPPGAGGALVANLVAPPMGGTNFGGFSGASVANLVAPPPGGTPNTPDLPDASPDAASPDAASPDAASPDDGGARDAAADGAT